MNFCTINKQVTVCSIIMQAQTKFYINFSKIDRDGVTDGLKVLSVLETTSRLSQSLLLSVKYFKIG